MNPNPSAASAAPAAPPAAGVHAGGTRLQDARTAARGRRQRLSLPQPKQARTLQPAASVALSGTVVQYCRSSPAWPPSTGTRLLERTRWTLCRDALGGRGEGGGRVAMLVRWLRRSVPHRKLRLQQPAMASVADSAGFYTRYRRTSHSRGAASLSALLARCLVSCMDQP